MPLKYSIKKSSCYLFCRSGDVTIVEDPLETFVKCTKSALVVSEVFCLPKDYRKDVPPPGKLLLIRANL